MSVCDRVLVTGGSGFVGRHFCAELTARGIDHVALSSRDCDLADLDDTVACFARNAGVTSIVHLASYQAAGNFPAEHPFEQLQINTRIHLNVLAAWQRVLPSARLVAVGTSCAYPTIDGPLQEPEFLNGPIHGSVYAYGMTKRLLRVGIDAAIDQHGLDGSLVIPATMFGEHDDFDPDTAHVCGALIQRFCHAADAGLPRVDVWGDGGQVRDLMDVRAFAKTLLDLLPRIEKDVVNVGPGSGTEIRELAEHVARAARYEGEIVYDDSRYVGVRTKFMDAGRLATRYGLKVEFDLRASVERTVRWFQEHYRDCAVPPKFEKDVVIEGVSPNAQARPAHRQSGRSPSHLPGAR